MENLISCSILRTLCRKTIATSIQLYRLVWVCLYAKQDAVHRKTFRQNSFSAITSGSFGFIEISYNLHVGFVYASFVFASTVMHMYYGAEEWSVGSSVSLCLCVCVCVCVINTDQPAISWVTSEKKWIKSCARSFLPKCLYFSANLVNCTTVAGPFYSWIYIFIYTYIHIYLHIFVTYIHILGWAFPLWTSIVCFLCTIVCY